MTALRTQPLPTLWDRFFEDAWPPVNDEKVLNPQIEIRRNDSEYRILAQLPGLKKEDVQVEVENGELKLSGKYSAEEKTEHKTVHSEIRRYAEFRRNLRIDQDRFDLDRVSAKMENGVLEVTLPLRAGVKARQIQING